MLGYNIRRYGIPRIRFLIRCAAGPNRQLRLFPYQIAGMFSMRPALVDYLKHHGRKKVLFGSNYPMITPAKALAGIDALALPPEVQADFLDGNARRVFNL